MQVEGKPTEEQQHVMNVLAQMRYQPKVFYYRPGWDIADTSRAVVDFVSMFIELKKLHNEPEASLELETRPGNFVFYAGNEQFNDHFSRLTIHKLSKADVVIINSKMDLSGMKALQTNPKTFLKAKEIERGVRTLAKLNSDSGDFVRGIKSRFEPGVSQEFFFSRLGLFTNNTCFEHGVIQAIDPTFSLDFSLDLPDAKDTRFTWDLITGEFLRTQKKYKSTLDLCHLGIEYRMSGCIEINKELPADQLHAMMMKIPQIKFARLKIRHNFLVHNVLEVSFTRAFEINADSRGRHEKQNGSEESASLNLLRYLTGLLKTQNISSQLDEVKGVILSKADSKLIPIHEVEVEYKDTKYLMFHYDNMYQGVQNFSVKDLRLYYESRIDMFLMNSELLFAFKDYPKDDVLFMPEYRKFFYERKEEFPIFPMIGGYLETIFTREKKRKRKIVDELNGNHNHTEKNKQTSESNRAAEEESKAAARNDPRIAMMPLVRANSASKN